MNCVLFDNFLTETIIITFQKNPKKNNKSFVKSVDSYYFLGVPDSFVTKSKVNFCDCYTRDLFVLGTKTNSVTLTPEIHLFEFKVVFCHLWLQS